MQATRETFASPPESPRPALRALVPAGAAVLALAALRFLVEPDPRGLGTHEQLGLPPCGFFAFTALPCPLCGVVTSMALFTRGRFLGSLATQPLGSLAALSLALAVPWTAWMLVRGGAPSGDARWITRRRTVALIAAVAALCWAWKLGRTP